MRPPSKWTHWCKPWHGRNRTAPLRRRPPSSAQPRACCTNWSDQASHRASDSIALEKIFEKGRGNMFIMAHSNNDGRRADYHPEGWKGTANDNRIAAGRWIFRAGWRNQAKHACNDVPRAACMHRASRLSTGASQALAMRALLLPPGPRRSTPAATTQPRSSTIAAWAV